MILFCLLPFGAYAQEVTEESGNLTVAALYSSDVSYYGQSTSEKLPYVLINTTYRFPVGIYLSAGAYKLLNYGSGVSETDLGLGYEYDFNDDLNVGLSYTRSFFPANSPLLQASNENNINLSASYSWPFLKSTLSTDYMFGTQSDVFLSLNNSKEIALGSLFSAKNLIYIEPAVELVAGTRHFYETYTIAKGKRDKAKGKAPSAPGNSGSASSKTETVASSSFNVLSYNFRLPLSLSRDNYIAEVSYQFSVLGAGTEPEMSQQQSFFGLAFYYQF